MKNEELRMKNRWSINAARGVGFIAYGKKSEKICLKILSAIALEIKK